MAALLTPILVKVRFMDKPVEWGKTYHGMCDVLIVGTTAIIQALFGSLKINDSTDLFKQLREKYGIKKVRWENKGKWKEFDI